MAKLKQASIDDVLGTDVSIRAQVLYFSLVEGRPLQKIEKSMPEISEHLGWNSWQIIHFYSFGKKDKGQHKHLTLDDIKKQISILDDNEISSFYLQTETSKVDEQSDIFYKLKVKMAEAKIKADFKKSSSKDFVEHL